MTPFTAPSMIAHTLRPRRRVLTASGRAVRGVHGGRLVRYRLLAEAAARVTAPHFACPAQTVFDIGARARRTRPEAFARKVAAYLANTSGNAPLKSLALVMGYDRRDLARIVSSIEDMRDDRDFDALLERLERDFRAEAGLTN